MKLKKLTKRKAVLILIILALILIALVLIRGPNSGIFRGDMYDVSKNEGRIEYLSSLGWTVDGESEAEEIITLPKSFNGVIADYAQMQSRQGFDFCSYGGCECKRYTYTLLNYPDEGMTVYAVLFIKGNSVIGGDIHSAEIGGFMIGIK